MNKKFLTNLLLLIFLNFLIKPFWFFGIEVAVQNRVGEASYGFYFALFNFAFILNMLLDLGLNNFNNRAISRDPKQVREYLSRIIPLKFLLSFVYAIVVFGLGLIIGYDRVQFKLLAVLVLNQFMASMILYLRSNISGLQYFRTDSLLSVLDRTIMIILNGMLLWSGWIKQPFQIEWFVYSQTVSYLITMILVAIVLRRYTGTIKVQIDFKKSLGFLKKSYPFALLVLLMAFFHRADSVMLERMLPDGARQAGIYAQSYRILDALTQIAVLFAGLLLPMFSRMLKTREDYNSLVILSASLLLTVAIALAILGWTFNESFIALLYHGVDAQSPRILGYLITAFVFISSGYVYGTLLTANHNLRQLNMVAAATVALNFSLNLLLIPRYKAEGAAIASLASQAFYAIVQVALAIRILKLSRHCQFLLRLAIFTIGGALGAWVCSLYVPHILASLAILTALFMGLAMATRLIEPKNLIRTFREE